MLSIIYKVSRKCLPKDCLRLWLSGSQGCEELFRLLRSMTPVFSTIVNFTLKGILERIHRLNHISAIECAEDIIFPRLQRRLMHMNNETNATFEIPSIEDIESAISSAKKRAIGIAKKCGISLISYADLDLVKDTTGLVQNAVASDHENDIDDCQELSLDSGVTELPRQEISQVNEDISVLKLKKKFHSGFPIYVDTAASGSGKKSYSTSIEKDKRKRKRCPFMNYNGSFIRKSTALYLLQENCQLSNDRLLRVRTDQPEHLFSGHQEAGNEDGIQSIVRVGDMCVFQRVESSNLLLGRAVCFSYLEGNKRQRQYSSQYVDLTKASYTKIGVFANWFSFEHVSQAVAVFMPLDFAYKAGYLSMEHYQLTINDSHLQNVKGGSFAISTDILNGILPEWELRLTKSSEFEEHTIEDLNE